MKYLLESNIIQIMKRTLDCVDKRLMDHGLRVAYMTFKIMRKRQKYTRQQLRDICILALLHDIGAYKTEEIDMMLQFETEDVRRHSAYGYLFLHNFSPLKELAPALFFHHADCRGLQCLHPSYQDLANIISICDCADIFVHLAGKDNDALRERLRKNRGKQFLPHIVDEFYGAQLDFALNKDIINADADFNSILYGTPLTEQEAFDYLKMIVLSIDFRSQQTAVHTIAVSHIAALLATFARLDNDEKEKIATGALLHDLGKTGVPIEVLENPNRLSNAEMTVMKTHVVLSEEIITGCVNEEIKRIAVRHHEKLDGSGYPHGVAARDLTVSERLLAVADILSALATPRSYKDAYPKEKTLAILDNMVQKKAIDADMVALAVDNFDYIASALEHESKPVIDMHRQIHQEYESLIKRIHDMQSGKLCDLLIQQGCGYL